MVTNASDCGDSEGGLPSVLEEEDQEETKSNKGSAGTHELSQGASHSDGLAAAPAPTLSMVTKHSNGTLNLWQLSFADKSKFSQVIHKVHQ